MFYSNYGTLLQKRFTGLLLSGFLLLIFGAASCGGDNPGSGDPGVNPPGSDVTAPRAELTFPPSEHFSTIASTLLVKGSAQDATGIQAVRVNGIEATSEDGFAHWQAQVPLMPGENSLVVETEDILSNKDPQAVTSSILSSAFLGTPSGTAADSDYFYVTDVALRVVLRIPRTGEAAEVLFDADTDPDDENPDFLKGIVVDEDYLYVADAFQGTIRRIPKTGGKATVLNDGGLSRPEALVVDGPDLYISDTDLDKIFRMPKTGGSPEEVVISGGPKFHSPNSMVLDGADLYVADSGFDLSNPAPPSVIRIKKAGGQAAELVYDNAMFPDDILMEDPTGLTLEGDDLYVTSAGLFFSIVLRIPKEGNQPSELLFTDSSAQGDLNLNFPLGVIVDGPDLCLVDAGIDSLLCLPKAGSQASRLIFDDDADRNLVNLSRPYIVAATDDDDNLYFVDIDLFAIYSIPKAGGPVKTIFNHSTDPSDINLFFPTGVATDDNDLYVTDADLGMVIRIPKTGGKSTLVSFLDDFVHPEGLTMDGDALYLVDSNLDQVLLVPKAGGAAQMFFDSDSNDDDTDLMSPQAIAVDSEYLYVLDSDLMQILRINKADPKEKGTELIYDNSMNEGPRRILSQPQSMSLYGDYLYVLDSDLAHLVRIPKTGGPAEILLNKDTATGDVNLYTPVGLAVSKEGFYLTDVNLDALVFFDPQTSQSLIFRGL
ncbi:MAG TPA: hypothetical protein DF383_06875 [Deltaproteobacteria bacterium]|nr:hypothetical protein [Deltaproteobacteria bacterium]